MTGIQWLQAADLGQVRTVVLALLLVAAAVTDVRTMRIPNRITMTGALVGLALGAAVAWQSSGPAAALAGFLWALGGAVAGLLLLLPLYVVGAMGAGDVKLMAMVGAFVGLKQIGPAVLCVFLVGGAMAFGWAVRRRVARRLAGNAGEMAMAAAVAAICGERPSFAVPESLGRLPYAVSVAAGTFTWLAVASLLST